jgi:hypothetical protein
MPLRKPIASMRNASNASPQSSSSSPRSDLDDDAEAYELHETNRVEDGANNKADKLDAPVAEYEGLLPSPRRFSMGSAQSYELYTPDEDRAVLRKLDRRLVTFMALLYCLSFLDRSSKCFRFSSWRWADEQYKAWKWRFAMRHRN